MGWVSEWAFDEVQEGGSNAVALQQILDARMRQRDETA